MKFYTWKDIDRYILMHHKDWENTFNDIEVYPDEIILYPREKTSDLAYSALADLFPKNILPDCSAIKLDCPNASLSVSYDFESGPISPNIMPLFKKAIYEDSVYPKKKFKRA